MAGHYILCNHCWCLSFLLSFFCAGLSATTCSTASVSGRTASLFIILSGSGTNCIRRTVFLHARLYEASPSYTSGVSGFPSLPLSSLQAFCNVFLLFFTLLFPIVSHTSRTPTQCIMSTRHYTGGARAQCACVSCTLHKSSAQNARMH